MLSGPLEKAMTNLDTRRLTLTPLGAPDLDWFHTINTQPEVRRFLWDDQVISRDAAREMLSANEVQFAEHRYGLWKAERQDLKIGYYGLWHFFGEAQPQLVYVTDRLQTGKGIASEASAAVLAYAFDTLGFAHVDAATDTANAASRSVALSLGFEPNGERTVDGKPTLFFRKFGGGKM